MIIFNILIAEQPHHDAADLVLGGMVLAHGPANIADQFFGWHPRGWRGGFLAYRLYFFGVAMRQKSSVTLFASLVSHALTPDNTIVTLGSTFRTTAKNTRPSRLPSNSVPNFE
ncbi:MAG: hypothetical protein ACK5WN_10005 [Alphaproteobacteria bacterium]